MKHTVLVGTPVAWQRYRFAACEATKSGTELLNLVQVACKLAGGFARLVEHERLQQIIRDALSVLPLSTMSSILALPGTSRAIATTLGRAWETGLDLQASADQPRVRDLVTIENYVRARVGAGVLLLPDLIRAAESRVRHAPRLFGSIRAEGFVHIAPAWRPLLSSLAESVDLTVHVPSCVSAQFTWTGGTNVRVVVLDDNVVSSREIVVCANPRHEVVEALRWARGLIASGQAQSHEIAIIAANAGDYDADLRTMTADSQLPVHFAHGRLAISEFFGQQAASLADIVRNGLSQDRVVRVLRLVHKNISGFDELPSDWYARLPREAPLLNPDQWERALAAASVEPGYERVSEIVLPVVALMNEGVAAAAKMGTELLSGRAAALWNRALAVGPAAAVDSTVEELRFPDASDQEASILWGPSDLLVGSGRKFIRLLGMTSRGWPRTDSEDPLLPDRIVPTNVLQPLSRAWRDRLSLGFCISEAGAAVYSHSRRDREGRLLAASPLLPAAITPTSIQRAAVPRHAFSQSDRLLARPEEFAQGSLARSASICVRDWARNQITAHDGLVRAGHPVLTAALARKHSASSLRSLLTDPLGFVWRYVFRWHEPQDSEGEEPLTLDRLQIGTLVHEILEEAVSQLEPAPGILHASEDQVKASVIGAAAKVASKWELETPLPPRCVWQAAMQEAISSAQRALTFPLPPAPSGSQRTYVEVAFNDDAASELAEPWNARSRVELTGAGLLVTGRIDRLELDTQGWARVVDYKVKRCPKEDPGLDGGKELQRCLYAFAVKQLLPAVQTIESILLFVNGEVNAFKLLDTDAALADVVHYTNAAIQYLEHGNALAGPDHDYDDLIFAYPANALGTYFGRKSNARNEMLANLVPLWGAR